MIITIGNYRLVPYESGECWHVFRWQEAGKLITSGQYKGRLTKEGWMDACMYPATIERAVELFHEYAIREAPGEYTLDEAVVAIQQTFRELQVRVEEATGAELRSRPDQMPQDHS